VQKFRRLNFSEDINRRYGSVVIKAHLDGIHARDIGVLYAIVGRDVLSVESQVVDPLVDDSLGNTDFKGQIGRVAIEP